MDSVYWENNDIKYYYCFRSLAFLSDVSILMKFVKIDVKVIEMKNRLVLSVGPLMDRNLVVRNRR